MDVQKQVMLLLRSSVDRANAPAWERINVCLFFVWLAPKRRRWRDTDAPLSLWPRGFSAESAGWISRTGRS